MANETKLPNGLTQRQFSFYNHLIRQMKETGKRNPKQAAIETGFSVKNASAKATRLLKKPEGQAYLKSIQESSIHSAIATINWVMKKLVCVVRAGVADDGTIKKAKAVKDALCALAEINKIKGHCAPEKKFNLNLDMDALQEARVRELTIKYTREY